MTTGIKDKMEEYFKIIFYSPRFTFKQIQIISLACQFDQSLILLIAKLNKFALFRIVFKSMNNEKVLKEENDRLSDQLRKLQEKMESQQHENRKALLEAKTKLDFQTRRADEYEEKYKSTLQYRNQEETVQELDLKLREKEDEVIKLLRMDHDKTQQIQTLLQEIEEYKRINDNLESELSQIKEVAYTTIMDKDTTINQLQERLDEYQDTDGISNLKAVIVELQEKYRFLEERNEESRLQSISAIEEKDEEINELQEKLSLLKDKHDQRVSRLEQDLADYEKHIEEMAAERNHEENLEEKYYHTEEKLRKAEKKLLDFEQITLQEKTELAQYIQKLELENENTKAISDELKQTKIKLKEYEKDNNNKKRELEQFKEKLDKANQDLTRKISHLENEKKIISDHLNIKQQEMERLKSEIDEKLRTLAEPTLRKEKSSASLTSPQKKSETEDSLLVQKLKKQNKDLEETNESLKRRLQEQTKELQEARQRLLQASSSQNSNVQVNKLMLQLQDINSYLKKVENDMLMKKITHAEDENFWSIKEKKYKQQIDNLNKKYKKQNSQLLERIDRMKKLVPKDKKTDYYQSGFK